MKGNIKITVEKVRVDGRGAQLIVASPCTRVLQTVMKRILSNTGR